MRSAIELFLAKCLPVIRTTFEEDLTSSLGRPGIVILSASTLILLNHYDTSYVSLIVTYELAFPEAVDARLGLAITPVNTRIEVVRLKICGKVMRAEG